MRHGKVSYGVPQSSPLKHLASLQVSPTPALNSLEYLFSSVLQRKDSSAGVAPCRWSARRHSHISATASPNTTPDSRKLQRNGCIKPHCPMCNYGIGKGAYQYWDRVLEDSGWANGPSSSVLEGAPWAVAAVAIRPCTVICKSVRVVMYGVWVWGRAREYL